jgi:hypothetical protein
MEMKIEIAAEKNHRACKRAQHANFVLQDSAASNERESEQQKNRARAVQSGIDGRKL